MRREDDPVAAVVVAGVTVVVVLECMVSHAISLTAGGLYRVFTGVVTFGWIDDDNDDGGGGGGCCCGCVCCRGGAVLPELWTTVGRDPREVNLCLAIDNDAAVDAETPVPDTLLTVSGAPNTVPVVDN